MKRLSLRISALLISAMLVVLCSVFCFSTFAAESENTKFIETDYLMVTNNNYNEWKKSYYENNMNVSFDKLDNINTFIFSSDKKNAILGTQYEGKALDNAKREYGDDLSRYKYIADNISFELSKFSLYQNTVLFKGVSDVSNITGKTSSIIDMKSVVGKTYKSPALFDTTLDHSVALKSNKGSYGVTLLIYAPKDITKGAYIDDFSQNKGSYEFVIDKDTKYKVIDAGVRTGSLTGFDGIATDYTERYMKLLIVK